MQVSDASGVLAPGFRLERYRIDRMLAAGGFGITYLAVHEGLGKEFAVKEHFPREFASREGTTVRPNTADKEIFAWALARFAEEARKLARFKHAAIVDVVDVFEGNGTAYMVMSFEPGETLSRWLEGLKRRPSQEELDRIAAPLLDALELMHAAAFLHRDIAPDNIMVRPDGSPCLIDFGAARQAMGQQTKTLTAIVKAGYSPVEQYDTEGQETQGPFTDIYALAATLYRAVTGSKPPEAPGRTLKDRCVPARQSAPAGYRPGFLAAIDAGLHVAPPSRPQSVAQWRGMLLAESRVRPLADPNATIGVRPLADPYVPARWQAGQGSDPHPRIPLSPPAGRGQGLPSAKAEGVGQPPARSPVAAPHPDPLPIRQSEWGEGDRPLPRRRTGAWLTGLFVLALGAGMLGGVWWLRQPPPAPVIVTTQPAPSATPLPRDRVLSAVEERALKPKDEFQECDVCPRMVVVPAGRFDMGSPPDEKDRDSDEGPVHEVTIAKAFAVGKLEVTFAEWEACAADGGCQSNRSPSDSGWGRGTRPVINVSWSDAQEYVAWLKRKTGKSYRLLTEAEWEYAARAGTRTPFHTGVTITTDQANYDGNFTYGPTGRKGEYRKQTVSVGSFPANAFGLFDMHGNVWELVEDCWNSTYNNVPTDGSAWTTGDCGRRVLRGGSWVSLPGDLRSAIRFWFTTGDRLNFIGFRLGRTLTP